MNGPRTLNTQHGIRPWMHTVNATNSGWKPSGPDGCACHGLKNMPLHRLRQCPKSQHASRGMVRGRCSPPCHPGSSAELRNASPQVRSMSAEQCRESFLVLADVQRLVEEPTHVPKVFARRQSTLAGRPPSWGAEASTVNPSSPRLCLFRLVVAYTDPPCVSLHRLRFRSDFTLLCASSLLGG